MKLSRHPLSHCLVCTATEDAEGTTSPEERLMAITDEGVTMFSLPSLSLRGQAFRTRGAIAMSWHAAWRLLAVSRAGGLGKPNQCAPPPPGLPPPRAQARGVTVAAGPRSALRSLKCPATPP